MQNHALLIDAMGTLLTLDDPAPRLVATLRARTAAAVSVDDARHALRAEIAYYRAHMQDGRDAESLAALRARCGAIVRDALPVLGGADPAAVTEALVDALHFTAFPDAAPLLRRVRETDRGARIIVVSNWDVSLPDALSRAGLGPLVDGVVTSAGVGARKPDPAIFAAALSLAGVPAGQCLHVGDTLTEDVAGARAAGIEPVLLRRDGGDPAEVPAGVRTVTGLDELPWP